MTIPNTDLGLSALSVRGANSGPKTASEGGFAFLNSGGAHALSWLQLTDDLPQSDRGSP